jgi:cytochrome c553
LRNIAVLGRCVGVTLALVCCHAQWASAASAAQLEFQAALKRVPDPARGRELYPTCAGCHGLDGTGAADGSVPAIAGQYYAVILKQLVDFRETERWNQRMEKVLYQRHLIDLADFADIAGYVSSLPRPANRNIGDGSALGAGTGAYFRDCASCHGAVGQGSAAQVIPRLGGQHYAYLVRQIRLAGDLRRPNMTAVHARTVRQLSAEEINGAADYLSRLDPAAERR